MNELWKFVIARLSEASTWRGIAYTIAGATGYSLSESQATSIIAVGMALAGVFAAFMPDKISKPEEKK